MNRLHLHSLLATSLIGLAAMAAQPALAQSRPVADASVNELISALSDGGGATQKAFRLKPDTSGRCVGQESRGGNDTKNLEVEYAEDGAAQVHLALRFEYNAHTLTASDKRLLDKVAAALNSSQLRTARFAVAGHTDRSGDETPKGAENNLALSCGRALSAKEYLVSRGVSNDRLLAYGFGSKRLLSGFGANAPEHRRVEIRRAD